jgi:DNA-binding transcriptional LysR family regulator
MSQSKSSPKGNAKPTAVNPISIRWALSAAEHRSFRGAARELGVGHPSVSRHIRALEDGLGISLFERSRRGLKVTHAGRQFFAVAREAFRQLQHASQVAAEAGQGSTGGVSIGIQPSMGAGFLRELLQAYSARHPNVTIEFVEGASPAEHISLVQQRRLDVAFVVGDTAHAANCDAVPLWKERLFVALPSGHRLKHRTAVGWPALRNERFIIRQAKCDPELCERVIKHLSDHTPGAVIQKLNVGRETLMHLVSIGRGLTITSEAAVATAYPDVIFLPISGDDETVQFSAVWLRGNRNPALLRLLSLAKVQAEKARDQASASSRPNPRRSATWPISLSFVGALSRRLGLST